MEFEVTSTDGGSHARAGRLTLAHGTVETPIFMPVGSRATVRGLLPEQIRATGADMILGNTYHLALRPGEEIIAQQGGLHEFMQWDGPILTDSGGYQVFSLSEHRELTEAGVRFRSPLDGSEIFLGPHEATRIQEKLGSDVAMIFDHCAPYPCTKQQADEALERTFRWGRMCKDIHRREDQALFGIVQGGVFDDLRAKSLEGTVAIGYDGYAIGGVSVGEEEEHRRRAVTVTAPNLPAGRPRYLMGVGFPVDVVHAVGEGVDMFDCVAPTRMGRNATAFTPDGRLRIRNATYKRDPRPVQQGCGCRCCRLYSRSYVHHLFRVNEMLGPILLTIHNLTFYGRMMADARMAISKGRYANFRHEFIARYRGSG